MVHLLRVSPPDQQPSLQPGEWRTWRQTPPAPLWSSGPPWSLLAGRERSVGTQCGGAQPDGVEAGGAQPGDVGVGGAQPDDVQPGDVGAGGVQPGGVEAGDGELRDVRVVHQAWQRRRRGGRV